MLKKIWHYTVLDYTVLDTAEARTVLLPDVPVCNKRAETETEWSQIPEKPEKRWDKDEENKNVRVATTISTVATENSANEISLQCSRGVIKFYNGISKAASKVFLANKEA